MRTFDIKPITEKLLWGKVLAGISHFSFLPPKFLFSPLLYFWGYKSFKIPREIYME